MKTFQRLLFIVVVLQLYLLCSCQESLEDKAERQAKEYTRKYCPTPVYNYTSTDSITFDRKRKVYTYYVSFYDDVDDVVFINDHREEIVSMLQQSLKESTSLKTFMEAGFRFEYVCHSGSDPKRVLLKTGM